MNIFQRFTCKSLKKNKTRTVVTIIGIILSVAMITAVTTTISSLADFMLKVLKEQDGSWHGYFEEVKREDGDKIIKQEEVEDVAILQNIGYAKLQDSQNQSRPYLYIGAYSGDFTELLSVHMKKGHLPKNATEIIVPSDLQDNGGISYQIGDVITLDVGVRQAKDGSLLWQGTSFDAVEEGDGTDKFVPVEKKDYRVVGIYTSASFDYGDAPGYPALTKPNENSKAQGESIWLTLKKPEKLSEFLKRNEKYAEKTSNNRMYLAYMGKSPNKTVQKTMAGLMGILIGIIMFGSISLIANSFAISVNERKKQYGLLSSIGATKKQLMKSVLFESVVLSGIGIPLGILAGLGGMAVTFYCLEDTFSAFFQIGGVTYEGIRLQLSASVFSVVLAAVLGFITILISAYLPARKALKVSAIEVIRQSDDIKIKPKKLKTSALTEKLFGMGGVLASKNFKRNKKKYRATVFSLFISIVLFISASSFCDYMERSLSEIVDAYRCDLNYRTLDMNADKTLYPELSKVKGIKEASYHVYQDIEIILDASEISSEHKKATGITEKGPQTLFGIFTFVDDVSYEKYLKENGFDTAVYMNKDKPTALAIDRVNQSTFNAGTYNLHNILRSDIKSFDTMALIANPAKLKEGYEIIPTDQMKLDEQGNFMCRIGKWDWKKNPDGSEEGEIIEGSEKYVPMEEAYDISDVHVGALVDEPPLGIDIYMGNALIFMYPKSALETICKSSEGAEIQMFFTSDNPQKSYREMCKVLQQKKLSTDSINNVAEQVNASRAMMTVLSVFSYGFIILISLIAAANVFNTISTNISLRRREFAMLRSVGMTQKEFMRMMNFECILYGAKGILYGVPVAIGVTFLIYRVLSGGIAQGFYIPWYSVVIAMGSVFIVVFSTMLYSMSKVRKDNVVETLRNENY